MKTLPDFSKAFEYENNFYLSCGSGRLSKVLAHYELFKATQHVPGAMVECGIFKGASLVRFAMMRQLFGNAAGKKIIGFDTFGEFPETQYQDDKSFRDGFIRSAGEKGISVEELWEVLRHKKVDDNLELVKGDVCQTVPEYVRKNPNLKISLLNLDTDIYEPAVTILEHLYPRITNGGILILDDYGVFPGETKAVDEYFKGKHAEILRFPFAVTPCYIVKKGT